jgi:hypothetical protein
VRIHPGYSFYKDPGGFCTAAFYPEDALTGFHDCFMLSRFSGNLKALLLFDAVILLRSELRG